MRRLFLLVAAGFLLLQGVAHAATPNETSLQAQVAAAGITTNTSGAFDTPIYQECVSWLSGPCPWPRANSFQRVNFDNVNENFTPKIAALTAAWQGVPLPAGWKAANGTDGSMIVDNYTGSGTEYIEMWKVRVNPANGHWTGVWGGGAKRSALITDADGVRSWAGGYGTSGSGIALTPGIVTLRDLQSGVINHPLHFAVRTACGHKPPAMRDDGKCWANSIQYGAKFKLAPIDVDAITSDARWCAPGPAPGQGRTYDEAIAAGWNPTTLRCPLPPMTKMIAKAAQTSVWVATDQQGNGASGSGVTFEAEGYDRPRVDGWANVPAGNPYGQYLGCDGIQGTGQSGAHPVTAQEGWEQDCVLASWKGFPYQQLYEIP